jgi:branched-chain amino acid transport system substrate-binding protein
MATLVPLQGCGRRQTTVKIGAVLPLSGAAANHGEDARDAIILARDDLNRSGGIDGSPAHVIFEDDQSTQQGSLSAANKLIGFDKVVAVLGPISSSQVLAAGPVAERSRTVLFSPSASSPALSGAGHFIFSGGLPAGPQGQEIAKFCVRQLGIHAVGVLYLDDDTGRSYLDAFRSAFAAVGGQILAVDSYEKTATDFRTQILKLRERGLKAVYAPAIPRTLGLIINQCSQLDYRPLFLANVGVEGEDLLRIAGDGAGRIYYTGLPVNSGFARRYRASFHRWPTAAASLSYDAFNILAGAIRTARRRGTPIADVLRQTDAFEGVTGRTVFSADGTARKELLVKTVRNGEFIAWNTAVSTHP